LGSWILSPGFCDEQLGEEKKIGLGEKKKEILKIVACVLLVTAYPPTDGKGLKGILPHGTNRVLQQRKENFGKLQGCIVPNFINDEFISIIATVEAHSSSQVSQEVGIGPDMKLSTINKILIDNLSTKSFFLSGLRQG
jgi:hypothetical protein